MELAPLTEALPLSWVTESPRREEDEIFANDLRINPHLPTPSLETNTTATQISQPKPLDHDQTLEQAPFPSSAKDVALTNVKEDEIPVAERHHGPSSKAPTPATPATPREESGTTNQEPNGQPFKYQPFDHEKQQIRLLRLLNTDDHHYIHCTLETSSLLNPELPGYTALSYCWGDPAVRVPIIVNQTLVQVTTNLEAALRQLRLRGYRCLWVDALCVNQADSEERGLQVQLMQQIFSRAELVTAWVGCADDDTAEAVKFLLERSSSKAGPPEVGLRSALSDASRPLTSPTDLKWLKTETETGETLPQESPRYSRLEKAKRRWMRNQWSIIQEFFDKIYWKRSWIIQEVAVATRLKVLYGHAEIEWEHVAAEIMVWKETVMSLPTSHLSQLYAYHVSALRAHFMMRLPISLLEAMLVTSKAMATDPRDKVFALRGLTSDGPSLVPTPNYNSSIKVILSDLTKAMIAAEKSLDIIFMKSLDPPVSADLPSWIPPWFMNSDFSYWSSKMTVLEKSLSIKRTAYNESPVLGLDDNTILVHGIILDEIFALSSALGHKLNPLLSKCQLEQCSESNQSLLTDNVNTLYPTGPTNALWQALCMEHAFHPVREDGQYYNSQTVQQFRSYSATLWSEQGRLDTSNDLQEWIAENQDMRIGKLTLQEWATTGVRRFRNTPAHFKAFCNAIEDILKSSMRLFVTRYGYLGMAPPLAMKGDRLCFLRGCSMPVILRGNSIIGYRVVGCCSVRSKFEPYAEACIKFAQGEELGELDPPLNIKTLRLI